MLTVKELKSLNDDRYKILPGLVPPKPRRDGEEARATLTEAGLPLFQASIWRLVAFQKAALGGVPVWAVSDPRATQAWTDYKAFGREILL